MLCFSEGNATFAEIMVAIEEKWVALLQLVCNEVSGENTIFSFFCVAVFVYGSARCRGEESRLSLHAHA